MQQGDATLVSVHAEANALTEKMHRSTVGSRHLPQWHQKPFAPAVAPGDFAAGFPCSWGVATWRMLVPSSGVKSRKLSFPSSRITEFRWLKFPSSWGIVSRTLSCPSRGVDTRASCPSSQSMVSWMLSFPSWRRTDPRNFCPSSWGVVSITLSCPSSRVWTPGVCVLLRELESPGSCPFLPQVVWTPGVHVLPLEVCSPACCWFVAQVLWPIGVKFLPPEVWTLGRCFLPQEVQTSEGHILPPELWFVRCCFFLVDL